MKVVSEMVYQKEYLQFLPRTERTLGFAAIRVFIQFEFVVSPSAIKAKMIRMSWSRNKKIMEKGGNKPHRD